MNISLSDDKHATASETSMEERQLLHNSPVNALHRSTLKPISPLCVSESNAYQSYSVVTNRKTNGNGHQANQAINQPTSKPLEQLNDSEAPSLQFLKGAHSNVVDDECLVTAF